MVVRHWALCLAQRRAKAKCSPGQTFKDIDPPRLLGTKSLWILGFVSDHAKLTTLWSRGLWHDYSRMRSCAIWRFERWSIHASLPVCFRLSIRAVRCYSHLARSYEVFHIWGGKTVMMRDRSQEIRLKLWRRPESGRATGVISSDRSQTCDRSCDIPTL
jgi:hypothetical protein